MQTQLLCHTWPPKCGCSSELSEVCINPCSSCSRNRSAVLVSAHKDKLNRVGLMTLSPAPHKNHHNHPLLPNKKHPLLLALQPSLLTTQSLLEAQDTSGGLPGVRLASPGQVSWGPKRNNRQARHGAPRGSRTKCLQSELEGFPVERTCPCCGSTTSPRSDHPSQNISIHPSSIQHSVIIISYPKSSPQKTPPGSCPRRAQGPQPDICSDGDGPCPGDRFLNVF